MRPRRRPPRCATPVVSCGPDPSPDELSDGSSLIAGKTITGFANVEENFTDSAVGQRVQPFRIEDEARRRGANYVQAGLFKAFAIRDNQLITGQQQYSGAKVAELVIESLGV